MLIVLFQSVLVFCSKTCHGMPMSYYFPVLSFCEKKYFLYVCIAGNGFVLPPIYLTFSL